MGAGSLSLPGRPTSSGRCLADGDARRRRVPDLPGHGGHHRDHQRATIDNGLLDPGSTINFWAPGF